MSGFKMFADTNLLISYLASDSNAEFAQKVMNAVEAGEAVLIVPVTVIQECCYVFEKTERFNLPRHLIVNTLIPFLLTSGFEVEEKDILLTTLRKYNEKKVDFTDAYLSSRSVASGIEVYNPKTFK